jgi:hypothetical protein
MLLNFDKQKSKKQVKGIYQQGGIRVYPPDAFFGPLFNSHAMMFICCKHIYLLPQT